MVVRYFAPRSTHNFAKNFHTNCGPLSISPNLRIPSGTIQLLRNMFALCFDAVQDVGIALASFE